MVTSKDIQKEFIKTYLKPILKEHGYKTSGQTWWKDKGDFFIVNLQNSSFNSKEELSFCLNIGVALTEKLADKEKRKASYFDLATHVREDAYLTEERLLAKKNQGGWLGYKITDKTELREFINDFKIDFEENILRILNGFKSLSDCVAFYDKFGSWTSGLKRQIEECGLKVD
jgi:hypothetical protein